MSNAFVFINVVLVTIIVIINDVIDNLEYEDIKMKGGA